MDGFKPCDLGRVKVRSLSREEHCWHQDDSARQRLHPLQAKKLRTNREEPHRDTTLKSADSTIVTSLPAQRRRGGTAKIRLPRAADREPVQPGQPIPGVRAFPKAAQLGRYAADVAVVSRSIFSRLLFEAEVGSGRIETGYFYLRSFLRLPVGSGYSWVNHCVDRVVMGLERNSVG